MKLLTILRWIACLTVIVVFVLPLVALAEDPDPKGEKLKALHETKEFKAALKKQAANSGDPQKWDAICGLEIMTGIGGIIWSSRKSADKCKEYFRGDSTSYYCMQYSLICDHYNWSATCLKDKGYCN